MLKKQIHMTQTTFFNYFRSKIHQRKILRREYTTNGSIKLCFLTIRAYYGYYFSVKTLEKAEKFFFSYAWSLHNELFFRSVQLFNQLGPQNCKSVAALVLIASVLRWFLGRTARAQIFMRSNYCTKLRFLNSFLSSCKRLVCARRIF